MRWRAAWAEAGSNHERSDASGQLEISHEWCERQRLLSATDWELVNGAASVQYPGEESQKTSKYQKGCLPQQPPSNGLKDPLSQVSFDWVSRPRETTHSATFS